ncbi:glycosyltransferase family 2 protein [Photobacterium damselae]
MKMISIIIACYNSSKTIKKCLNSIINQKYSNFEIICVDDGSVDNTKEIILSYTDIRIKYYHKKNGGASSAKNFGLKQAKGDYICIIDSDDYISENSLMILYNSIISDNNIDAALFDLFFIEQNKELTNLDMTCYPRVIKGIDAATEAISWNIHGICLYKRVLFNDLYFDESNIHGDELTTRIILSKCNKVVRTEARYYYVQHVNSVTIKFSIERFGIINNLIKLYDYYKSNDLLNAKAIIYFNIEISRVLAGVTKLLLKHFKNINPNEKNMIYSNILELSNYIDTTWIDIIRVDDYSIRIKLYLIICKLIFNRKK